MGTTRWMVVHEAVPREDRVVHEAVAREYWVVNEVVR